MRARLWNYGAGGGMFCETVRLSGVVGNGAPLGIVFRPLRSLKVDVTLND